MFAANFSRGRKANPSRTVVTFDNKHYQESKNTCIWIAHTANVGSNPSEKCKHWLFLGIALETELLEKTASGTRGRGRGGGWGSLISYDATW